MKNFTFISIVSFLSCIAAFAQVKTQEKISLEGQRIAAELRSSVPTEESSIRGMLEMRSKKHKISENIPVIFTVVPKEDHWDSIYETGQTATRGSEKLIVRRFEDRPNRYFYAKAPQPTAAVPELQEVKPENADISLAGSDFWLTDLGLDFLHWPEQRRIKGEMRLNQWCHVLESVFPGRPNTNKILSWIDKDSADAGIAGILIAEAYDPKGKIIKKFSLSGSSFKKINGQWQLEKMEIENYRTDSTTTLRFDLKNLDSTVSSAGN